MRVLIADEDAVARQNLISLLTKWDYDVVECKESLEAWKIIEGENAPNLLILDWEMPGMNGLENCRKLRELKKEPLPYVIFLTAKQEKEDVIEGIEAGANDFISKPFSSNELKVRLQSGARLVQVQEELLKTRDLLKIEATHDPLTGILNRRAIFEELHLEIERAHRSRLGMSIALIDVDYFKKVNDTYGHLVGDDVLKKVTEKIASHIRPYDRFGRYGGEEFLLVLPECDEVNAHESLDRIRLSVESDKIITPEGQFVVTISAGVRQIPTGDIWDIDTAMRAVDKALYRAKEKGRNRVEVAGE